MLDISGSHKQHECFRNFKKVLKLIPKIHSTRALCGQPTLAQRISRVHIQAHQTFLIRVVVVSTPEQSHITRTSVVDLNIALNRRCAIDLGSKP